MHVDTVLYRIIAQLVGFTDRDAGFHTAAGQPHGERFDMMISSQEIAGFALGRAAEFAAPDNKCIIEDSPTFEIFDQSCRGLVHLLAQLVESIRMRWPDVRIVLRGDSGFCREAIMAWCENNRVDYILGLAG